MHVFMWGICLMLMFHQFNCSVKHHKKSKKAHSIPNDPTMLRKGGHRTRNFNNVIPWVLSEEDATCKQQNNDSGFLPSSFSDDATIWLYAQSANFSFNETNLDVIDNYFNEYLPTVVFICGWMEDKNTLQVQQMYNAYYAKGGHNIIIVDPGQAFQLLEDGLLSIFDKVNNGGIYQSAARSVAALGKMVGENLAAIVMKYRNQTHKMHIIGFSLGAHVAGFAGKTYFQQMKTKISRITGLDPAYPCFENTSASDRLDKTDAYFVDIIHTTNGKAGIKQAIGHVDFYANIEEKYQPGCDEGLWCCHMRAMYIYTQSVSCEDGFMASQYHPTENPTGSNHPKILGYFVDRTARNKNYFKTTGEPPFYLGFSGIYNETKLKTGESGSSRKNRAV